MHNRDTKVIGSFVIGLIQTFYSLNALTEKDFDSSLGGLDPDQWYSLDLIKSILRALDESGYTSSMLFYQAGAAFIQSWYDNGGKALNHGSYGQFKLQENSSGIQHVFKDYDPEKLFTQVVEFDFENGYVVIENADMFPLDFTKGVFYNGINMWGDLLWLEMDAVVLAQTEEYTHSRFVYRFKPQDKQLDNDAINDFLDRLSLTDQPEISNYMALQLAWKLKGVKKLLDIEQQINKKSIDMLGLALKKQVEIGKSLEASNKIIKEQSVVDFLTGLNNKRFFDESIKTMWLDAMHHQSVVTVFMIDVDCFKLYNDTYGHLAGDEALKAIGRCIQGVFDSPSDIVARFGGEEFIVASAGMSLDQVSDYANTLLNRVNDECIPHTASLVTDQITISIGSSSGTPAADLEPEDLIRCADAALYEAKKSGRNRHEQLIPDSHKVAVES